MEITDVPGIGAFEGEDDERLAFWAARKADGRSFISENVALPLNASIDALDSSIREIRETRSGKDALCIELEMVQKECQELIKEIHLAS